MRLKKYSLAFSVIYLFSLGMFNTETYAKEFEQPENFTEADERQLNIERAEIPPMFEANIQKTINWNKYNYGIFEGDRLTNGQLSSRTTMLHLSRNTSYWDRYVDIFISDQSGKVNFAKGRISVNGTQAYIPIHAGTLQQNTTYSVHAKERWLLTGIVAKSYQLGYFNVSSDNIHTPPKIKAENRQILINRPFNYMEGVFAYDDEGTDISNRISYTGMVNTAQEGSYPVTYSVTDKNNLTSSKTITITVIKKEPEHLDKPNLDVVTDKDRVITGNAVPDTSVNVIIGQESYREKVSANGNFSVQLEQTYPEGTSIESYIENEQGDRSESVFTTVQSSVVPLEKPILHEITDKDTIVTGKGVPKTQIDLIMGVDKYRETINDDGTFSIYLDQAYQAGTGVEAFITDEHGNKSESTKLIVKPANDEIGINPIYTSDSIITGKTVPNVKIEASIENRRARIYEGTSDSTGNFVINMNGKTYPAATQVEITIFLPDGTKKSKKVIVYPKIPSVNTVNEFSKELTGTADPNATIKVLSTNGLFFEGIVDAAGNFRIPISGLKQGDILSVYQISNGINSEMTTITVQ